MTGNIFHKLSILLALLLTLTLITACSGTGSRKMNSDGSGSGSFSDEDLALAEKEELARWNDGGAIPKAKEGGLFADIYFDFDSASIDQESMEELRKNAMLLTENPDLHVEIEGHCDKRGTIEYNLVLGEGRAKAIASIFASHGVNSKQMSIISYGEEIPLDAGDSESAFAKNRRVHFVLYRTKKGGRK